MRHFVHFTTFDSRRALGLPGGSRNVLSVIRTRIVHFSAVEPHRCLPPPQRRPGLASRCKYHELLRRGLCGLGGRSRGRGKDDPKKKKLHHAYYLYKR